MSRKILITEEYLTARLFFVFLFVCALQVLKALFYANFCKLGWNIECSGLFCATLYVCSTVMRPSDNNKKKKKNLTYSTYCQGNSITSCLHFRVVRNLVCYCVGWALQGTFSTPVVDSIG